MRTLALRRGLACAALALSAVHAPADTIYLLDGTSLPSVTVGEENFKEISYKDGSKTRSVNTDEVLRIEFDKKSPLVDRADTAVVDGMFLAAIDDLKVYVDSRLKSERPPRFKWELAYAMYRIVELNGMVGDVQALIRAADQLIEKAPESRFVPEAFLAKAEAQFRAGNEAAAQKTLKDFLALVQGKSLSRRWQLEQKLASYLYDSSLKGKARRDKLDSISDQAGEEYPTVANRADVAVAESFLEGKKFKDAEDIFTDVTNNPRADPRTLAAAYTGLGDCLFKRAVGTSDTTKKQDLIVQAATAYMRVVVVYKDQTLYAPKAMFWAGRVFDESSAEGDKEKAQKLYTQVIREYQGSHWAEEANAFRKR